MLTTPGTARQDAPRLPTAWRRWGALASLAVAAALLRLWHIEHGLPDFTEEAIPFREALEMWGWRTGRTDLNPHFFHYPTLTIYLQFALQKLQFAFGLLGGRYHTPADFWLAVQHQPALPVVLARSVGVAADVASVIGAWSLAEKLRCGSGWVAGVLVACATPLIVTSRLIYVDPIQAALAIWAVERLVTYQAETRRAPLVTAVVLIGLATGAKYNAGLLVLPLGWALLSRGGRRALTWWPVAVAGCVGVFLATSPYIVSDFKVFAADFAFERRHMSEGHLGTVGAAGGPFLLEIAWRHFGLGALLLLGRLLTLPRRWRGGTGRWETTVWLALVPAVASVAWFRMTSLRYIVPLVPYAAVLIAPAILQLADALAAKSARRRTLIHALTLAVVLGPVVASGLRAAAGGGDTTRAQAKRWCATHLNANHLILQEAYGAPLRNYFDTQQTVLHPAFAAASEPARRSYLAEPLWRSVELPMAASGRFTVSVTDSGGGAHELIVFPHAADFNQIFYAPALLHGVDYFVRSSGVSRRYSADPERYRSQTQLYELLDTAAEAVASFRAGGGITGPAITIYHLDTQFQALLSERFAYLDPYWWAAAVPLKYRLEAEQLFAPEQQTQGAVRRPNGQPAPWLLPLSPLFAQHIAPFLLRTAHLYFELERFDAASRNAGYVLALTPESLPANLIYARSQVRRGEGEIAQAALAYGVRARRARGLPAASIRLELAMLQWQAGALADARAELNRLLAEEPDGESATRARELLDRLATEPTAPPDR